MLGISQYQLAQAIGIASQQIQKYEIGANRLSASRLVAIAEALDVPAIGIDTSTLIPIYRVTFMKSRTTDAIRSATVVSVTNQGLSPCDILVSWFRGFDPTPGVYHDDEFGLGLSDRLLFSGDP